jgi:hypothetical protein
MTSSLLNGARESYRVLRHGGRIIVGERVPPSDEVRDEYKDMIRLKDNRVVFTENKLRSLLMAVGFRIVKSFPVWIGRISVRDWLNKCNVPRKVWDEIYDRHLNGSDEFKKAHRMEIIPGDMFIDIKNIVIVAEKP